MVVIEVAHKGAGVGARKISQGNTRRFESLINHLEELSLGWIQREDLLWVDTKEACIELPNVRFEKAAALGLE